MIAFESSLEDAGVVLADDLGFASGATIVCIYKLAELQRQLLSSSQIKRLEFISSSIS